MKRAATSQILDIYQSNKQKLLVEMAKPHKGKEVLNSIEALRHIVVHMEQAYNLPDSGV